jgi:mono/diheme cytochrome c family protein
MTRALRRLGLVCFLGVASACSSKPDDLREWTPDDHKHQTESGANPQRAAKTITPAEESQREVSAAIWKQQCATCHGNLGRGDGPQSVMVQARDLTDPAWQEATTDGFMAGIIKQGKGKMPAFRFPDTTVQGLVDLVRRMGRARVAQGRRQNVQASTGAAAPSDAPAQPPPPGEAPAATQAATPPAAPAPAAPAPATPAPATP